VTSSNDVDTPELLRLKLAAEANYRAEAARAELDFNARSDHPEVARSSESRRARIIAADAEVMRTRNELTDARDAVIMMAARPS
jgi:hypothetical protein